MRFSTAVFRKPKTKVEAKKFATNKDVSCIAGCLSVSSGLNVTLKAGGFKTNDEHQSVLINDYDHLDHYK
ncbi:hypothetical protein NQ318_020085 [Aromia moschata]|uniref:Uncharacterized protein n=1 Tax=Aromia moschata TaxID=1265417 RepID=A0AAV8ZB77_9CUCU|nr:hypothetical protein NQ318_020085 [Aromia moschata]